MSTHFESEHFKPGRIIRSALAGTVLGLAGIGGTYGFLHNWELDNPSNVARIGRELPNSTKGRYLTDPYGKIVEIPLRREPNLSEKSQIGYTVVGQEVVGQAVFGVVYPSDSLYLGNFESEGKRFGVWYRVDEVPLYQKDGSGKLVPVIDPETREPKKAKDVYIAGNFLRKGN